MKDAERRAAIALRRTSPSSSVAAQSAAAHALERAQNADIKAKNPFVERAAERCGHGGASRDALSVRNTPQSSQSERLKFNAPSAGAFRAPVKRPAARRQSGSGCGSSLTESVRPNGQAAAAEAKQRRPNKATAWRPNVMRSCELLQHTATARGAKAAEEAKSNAARGSQRRALLDRACQSRRRSKRGDGEEARRRNAKRSLKNRSLPRSSRRCARMSRLASSMNSVSASSRSKRVQPS